MDRRNDTGILVIEYTGDLGLTRIQYDGRIVPPSPVVNELIEGDKHTFQFVGTIFVWQLGEPANTDDKIVACRDQAVNVILQP